MSCPVAERVSKLTDGKFNIRVFAAGDLMPALDDYFDRLDAAFSASAGGDTASPFSELQAAPVPTPTLEMPTLDSFTFASLPAEQTGWLDKIKSWFK